jgi:periplasmic protein TonB
VRRVILFLLLCLGGASVRAQKVPEFVEKMPSFPGGESALAKYLIKIKYPKEQIEQGNYQGLVKLTFVVDTSGNVVEKAIWGKKASDYTLLEKEAIKLLNGMPRWIPGEQDGKKVAVRMHIPMRICLQE